MLLILGVGPSIKKAQQDAAQNALENTILPSPPSDCSNLRQRRRSKGYVNRHTKELIRII